MSHEDSLFGLQQEDVRRELKRLALWGQIIPAVGRFGDEYRMEPQSMQDFVHVLD